ncbi:MAG: hypothetical protein JNN22_02865 [Rhodospirillales bacterium]|nr:hypothetical protein [Rhodospirillales bacterium]
MSRPQGLHEDFDRDEKIVGSSDRNFGFVFAGFCALVGTVKFFTGHPWMAYWFAASAAFLVVALAAPRLLAPANRLWTKLGLVLYHVMNPLVMGLLYFTVITPMALVIRIMGKDLLRMRRDAAAASYWIVRDPPGPEPDTMKRQF